MSSEHTILAVDDNPINVKLLTRTLTNNSYNVISASSGEEAIQLARSQHPDLILLDVLMPGMDGYEACKTLKQDKSTAHIPVIFLSAKNETVDKARGLALGAVDYLTKPFDPVEIIARIQTHLDARKAVYELTKLNKILANELDELRQSKKKTDSENALTDFIKTLIPRKSKKINAYYKLFSRINIQKEPATTIYLPVVTEENYLLYIICGGFRKDYPTAVVQLMLQKYVEGLMTAGRHPFYNEHILMNILERILDAFSPDAYHTPFTISLNYVDIGKREYISLSIHQPLPYIFDQKCLLYHTDGFPLIADSKYAPIVRARRFTLPEKAGMIHYVSGKDTASLDIEEKILDILQNPSATIEEKAERISDGLPETTKDQLLVMLKIL
ncbi:MAG: response regulator [Calditrichaeota bacterium]|nr:MAG: response regulator [Calditrichota bacterium]